jgi:hypothetical protein
MDEAHRFIRYITPGVLFLGETAVLLYLLFPAWVGSVLETLKQDTGLGFAIVGVAATGSIGLLLSTIHHAFFNRTGATVLDYSALIRRLRLAGLPEVVDAENLHVETMEASRLDAWVMVSSLWHQLHEISPRIKGVEPRAQRLADLTHSMGTALVGSVVAWIIAMIIAGFVGKPSLIAGDVIRFVIAQLGAVGITVVLGLNYKNTALICQRVVEESLTDALADLKEQGKPVRTYVLINRATSGNREPIVGSVVSRTPTHGLRLKEAAQQGDEG